MSGTDHTHLLGTLIQHGERAIMSRQSLDPDAALLMIERVEAALSKPCEGRRIIDDHTMMFALALMHVNASKAVHDTPRAALYARVVGVMLPDIRADMLTALEQRKRPTP